MRDRRAAPRHRRAQRRDARPDRAVPLRAAVPGPGLRRRHRRAARGHLGRGPGHGRAAPGRVHLRDLPQPRLRPGAHGRRAAPPAGDLRPRPGRHHRQRRAVAPRHVGPVAARPRTGPAGRRAARRAAAAGTAARGGRLVGRPDRAALPEGRRGRGAAGRRAGWPAPTCCTPTPARRCCWSPSVPWPTPRAPPPWCCPPPGYRAPSPIPAGYCPWTRSWSPACHGYRMVVTIEDNGAAGGFGDAFARAARAAGPAGRPAYPRPGAAVRGRTGSARRSSPTTGWTADGIVASVRAVRAAARTEPAPPSQSTP